jgi:hypothetical protein
MGATYTLRTIHLIGVGAKKYIKTVVAHLYHLQTLGD